MHKPGTTSYRLIDWILVLALALAPLQSAWSAFDSRCQHEQDMLMAQLDSTHTSTSHSAQTRKCSHRMQQHSVSSSSSTAEDCCCNMQGHAGGRCAGSCQPVPAALYLPPMKPGISFDFYTVFESQQPVFNNGRTIPPPYQPPRS